MQQLTDQLLNFGTFACLLVCQLVYLLIFIPCPAYDLFSQYSFIIQKVQFSFLKIPIYYFHFTLLTLVSFLESSFTVIKYQNSKLMLYDNYSCVFIYIFYVFFVIFLKTSYYKKGSNEETTCVITQMTSA